MTSEECRKFLDRLDNSDLSLSDWETAFLEDTMTRHEFSERQRDCVRRMELKYGDKLRC